MQAWEGVAFRLHGLKEEMTRDCESLEHRLGIASAPPRKRVTAFTCLPDGIVHVLMHADLPA